MENKKLAKLVLLRSVDMEKLEGINLVDEDIIQVEQIIDITNNYEESFRLMDKLDKLREEFPDKIIVVREKSTPLYNPVDQETTYSGFISLMFRANVSFVYHDPKHEWIEVKKCKEGFEDKAKEILNRLNLEY